MALRFHAPTTLLLGTLAAICITALLTVLKVAADVNWSWLWIVSPLWGFSLGSFVLVVIGLLLANRKDQT